MNLGNLFADSLMGYSNHRGGFIYPSDVAIINRSEIRRTVQQGSIVSVISFGNTLSRVVNYPETKSIPCLNTLFVLFTQPMKKET